MTTVSHITDAGILARVWAPLAATFQAFGNAVAASAAAEARLEEVRRLQSCSDEKLAELGLKRDDIVRHVFREIYML